MRCVCAVNVGPVCAWGGLDPCTWRVHAGRRKPLRFSQKYFPWVECATLIFPELRRGRANRCWEGRQDSCRLRKLCRAPLARFSSHPCLCRVCVSVQVACPGRVFPAVMKQTYDVYIPALDTHRRPYPQPGKFPAVCTQRFNTWQPFLLCPEEHPSRRADPFNTSLRPADMSFSR